MTAAAPRAPENEAPEFDPQPGPQTLFFKTPADIAIIGGAVFGGKTWALCAEPLRHRHVRGFNAVAFRRVQPEIRQPGGLWDETLKLYGHFGGNPREQELEWRWDTGAKVKMSGLQYDKDAQSWKGAQITCLLFDQLEEFTAAQFWYMQSRNRSTCGVRPYTRASCNPLPGWLADFIQWWWDENTGYSIPERSGVIRWFVRINDIVYWSETTCPAGVRGARYKAIEREALAEMTRRFPATKEGRPAPGSFARSFTYILATIDDNAIGNRLDPEYEARVRSMSYLEQERLLGVEGRGGNWKIKPAAGLIFNRAMLEERKLKTVPGDIDVIARAWDKAGTEVSTANPDPDYTAGVKLGRFDNGRKFVILDIVHGRWAAAQRNAQMLATAQRDAKDRPQVRIFIEQEPGSGGKESAENSVHELRGFPVRVVPATTNILERSDPLAAQAQAGNLYMIEAPWNEMVLAEMHGFTGDGTEHDDIVSAASLAFNKIAAYQPPKNTGAGTRTVWTG